jgi:protein-S-isoprenylcysteine O-methyltransferase Ste14
MSGEDPFPIPRVTTEARGAAPPPHVPARRRLLALFHGALCHGLFAAAVVAMARGLFLGMTSSLGRLEGGAAIVANSLLLAQFPLVHSWLLAGGGPRVYRRLAPREHARTLAPTLYVSIASLQVLAVFLLWSPVGEPFWEAKGTLRALCFALPGASWLALAKSMADANLALQSGSLGWWALYRGRKPDYGPLPTRGLFAICRQPIYLSFAAITWTGPVWTIDHVVVTAVLTGYCLLGPLAKERRFERIHGDAFREYRARVPYFPGMPRRG